jgi:hypothetical protein
MSSDPHDTSSIPVGTPVVAIDGETLGRVRETHDHYILIDQDAEHYDLDLPVHAIDGLRDGKLHITLSRSALTRVDHEETVHRHDDPDVTGD